MMKAVIYCRVSTREQVENLSLATQEKLCREYCQNNNFETDQIFVDEGESAKTALRPEFQKMLSYCRENKGKIQLVIVYQISRFARNSLDHAVISALLKKNGISLRSATEPINDSSVGKLMENILAAFAQYDNDDKSERTKSRMREALERGRWTHIASIGYLNNKTRKDLPNLVIDLERAPLVIKAFELYATGLYTRPQVLKIVHDMGLRTRKEKKLSLQTFEDMLRNPIYCGLMRTTNQPLHQGSFEPLIDKVLFDKVQMILTGKKHTITPYQKNHPDFSLRQFIKCGVCNRPLTASWSRGRSQKYPYYRCPSSTCKAVNVRRENLEKEFVLQLERLKPKTEYIELFKAIVLDKWREQEAETIAHSKSLQKRVDELRTRRDDLEEAFIYKKNILQAAYDRQSNKLDDRDSFG